MSSLAPTLQAFFIDRLGQQRAASPHTVAAYRATFRMLLSFCHQQIGTPPSRLCFDDLGAELIAAFLDHTESARGNSVRTRNARLAAILPRPQRCPSTAGAGPGSAGCRAFPAAL